MHKLLPILLLLLSACASNPEYQPRKVVALPQAEKPMFPAVALEELERLAAKYRNKSESK